VGPLAGLKFLEIGGIGPTQLCGMLLADMGAEVVRIERPERAAAEIRPPARLDLMNRGRRSLSLDLKHPLAVEVLLRLCERADGLFEGFRPGVMERLGLGPEACRGRNPRLVYGRMTGWGQSGPLAESVGHDPNYIALAGALYPLGAPDRPPTPPLNLVGDFGGGALYLLAGMLAALLERERSSRGQVVDAAMVDGTASLMTLFHGLAAAGDWSDRRGTNLLDGAAPFYRAYRTLDEKFVMVAALEDRFFDALIEILGLSGLDTTDRLDRRSWPKLGAELSRVFLTRSRDQWSDIFEGTEGCVTPVLTLEEAPEHPHMRARGTYVEVDGVVQPAPAPRFARTPSEVRSPPPEPGQDTEAVLRDWGLGEPEIESLLATGASRPRS